MTEKQTLIAQAQEAGIQLTGKETVAQLKEMLTPVAKPEELDTIAPDKTEFTVVNADGGEVRTYSLEVHGPDAEKLAHQFATKFGHTVRA